jgi:hypothetical protein
MSRFTGVLACVALSWLPLAAQNQTVPPTPSTGPSLATVTVVGCIENAVADGSLGGTPLGTPASPANAGVVANAQPPVDGFLLTGATPASRSEVGTSGTADRDAATASSAAKEKLTTYALEGDRNELASHKGHRVEITGALAAPEPDAVNRAAGRGTDAFKTGVQRLRVQSIKMVATKCMN